MKPPIDFNDRSSRDARRDRDRFYDDHAFEPEIVRTSRFEPRPSVNQEARHTAQPQPGRSKLSAGKVLWYRRRRLRNQLRELALPMEPSARVRRDPLAMAIYKGIVMQRYLEDEAWHEKC